MSRRTGTLAALALSALAPRAALADAYALRADAFAAAATTPVGLVVLQAEERGPSWADAEAMVWTATGDRPGDALVARVRLRDPEGRGELRAGRMLFSTGAVRPLHLDGVALTGRAPFGTSLEVFGGMPVAPGFGSRSYDWVVGQRLSQHADALTAGVSYVQRRDHGSLAFEEVGVDAAAAPTPWLDGALTTALDLVRPGVASARASVAARAPRGRVEVYASRRSPSRLLPATSLFAALGDAPSDSLGSTLFFRVAPRLDLLAAGAVESLGGDLGGDASTRATLRLDDRGDAALSLELRRQGAPDASWTGARATLRMPVAGTLSASTEVEVAIPDEARDRGALWPWGLVALRYAPAPSWEAAAAVEASASPESEASLQGLLRLSCTWEGR